MKAAKKTPNGAPNFAKLLLTALAVTVMVQATTATPEPLKTQLFNVKTCKVSNVISPFDIYTPMKYKDFTVVPKFTQSKGATVSKLTGGSFLIEGDGFGQIVYNKKAYTIMNVYVKSPSEHKVEGQGFDAEI